LPEPTRLAAYQPAMVELSVQVGVPALASELKLLVYENVGLVIEICAKAGVDTAAASATTCVNLVKLGRKIGINKTESSPCSDP